MPTLTADTLDKVQPPAGGVQLDTITKARLRENQQDPANQVGARALSVASLEQFVRDTRFGSNDIEV